MKIYFCGSIRAGRQDVGVYESMISWLKAFGVVLTEHVGNVSLSESGDDGPDDRFIYDRDMAWLSACDLVIAEVTNPSLGVGYELGRAAALGKPVLCLHRRRAGKRLSAMIAGCPQIVSREYTDLPEARDIVEVFIRSLSG